MPICKHEDFLIKTNHHKNLLGIDHGSKLIGIAISNKELFIATPLTTIVRKKQNVDFNEILKIIKEKAYLISFLIFSGVVGYLNDILFEVLVFSLTVILLTYIYTEYKLKDWIRNYKRGEKTYAYGFIYDEFCSFIEQLDEDKKISSNKLCFTQRGY